jgi:putative ABC transport system permease protein
MLGVLVGAMLTLPALLAPMARTVGRFIAPLSRGAGQAAVAHLVRERSRSAYTAAVLMVVLCQGVVIGAASTSMSSALDQVLSRQFGADVMVANTTGSLPPAVVGTVLSTPGVGQATTISYGSAKLAGDRRPLGAQGHQGRVGLEFVVPRTFFRVEGFTWSAGTDPAAQRALTAGRGLLVPGPFARSQHLEPGSRLSLQTTRGPVAFTVAGIYRSFATGSSLVTSYADGVSLFGAGPPDTIALDARPGVHPDRLRLVLDRRLGLPATAANTLSGRGLAVQTAGEIKAGASGQMHGFFTLFEAVLGVALLVGLLGLANTLVMSVVARYREIGVLRAIGIRRRQVRAMVAVESLTLAAVAVIVAGAVGLPLSTVLVRAVASSLGYQIPYRLPWMTLAVVILVGGAVALLAAWVPARRAGRLDVVEALRYD